MKNTISKLLRSILALLATLSIANTQKTNAMGAFKKLLKYPKLTSSLFVGGSMGAYFYNKLVTTIKVDMSDTEIISDCKNVKDNNYSDCNRYEVCKLQLKNKKDGKELGHAYYSVKDNNAELASIYVKPEYRNQGIASKLITKAIEEAREKKCTAMGLLVFPLDWRTQTTNLVKFYQKHGFQSAPGESIKSIMKLNLKEEKTKDLE